jgi:hypothetical protein
LQDRSRVVNYSEFSQFLHDFHEECAIEAFKLKDKNGSGYITALDFQDIMLNVKKHLLTPEVKDNLVAVSIYLIGNGVSKSFLSHGRLNHSNFLAFSWENNKDCSRKLYFFSKNLENQLIIQISSIGKSYTVKSSKGTFEAANVWFSFENSSFKIWKFRKNGHQTWNGVLNPILGLHFEFAAIFSNFEICNMVSGDFEKYPKWRRYDRWRWRFFGFFAINPVAFGGFSNPAWFSRDLLKG